MTMKLPELTHLCYFTISLIKTSQMTGVAIRRNLKDQVQHEATREAFYQMMARLEKKGYVSGRFEVDHGPGTQTKKERVYQATKKGIDALVESQEFYRRF